MKKVVEDVVGVDPAGAVQEGVLEDGPRVAEVRSEYHQRPDPQGFDECTDVSAASAARTMRDDCG
ncbi:hypothetical protein GCM10027072_46710 [Streptomyces bullii]